MSLTAINSALAPVASGIAANLATSVASISIDAGVRSLGAWYELCAAAPFDVGGLVLGLALQGGSGGGGASRGFFEIGIGPAGDEVAVTEYANKRPGYVNTVETVQVPVSIPEGARIAIRMSASRSTTGLPVSCTLIGAAFLASGEGGGGCVIEGLERAGTSTTHGRGVDVDPGATANTFSAWVEITAGTQADYRALELRLGDDNSAQSDQNRIWQVSIGAAGSEGGAIIIDTLDQYVDVTERLTNNAILLPWGLPEGTRVSVRMQTSITDASDRVGTAYIIGHL